MKTRAPLTFWLRPRPPFRLDLTAWALRRRPSNTIDRWDGESYRRVLVLEGRAVEVAVRQQGGVDSPRLQVSVSGSRLPAAGREWVRKNLERLLGLDLDLSGFYRLAAGDAKLAQLARTFRGLKPPKFPSIFEVLANAIACQQLSLSLGILLLGRITERFGLSVEGDSGKAFAFPRPEDLAGLKPEVFRKLGFSRQKGRSLIELAQVFCSRSGEYENLKTLDNASLIERLLELRGVGRWSAEYALLRGYGRTDVYPGDDIGARKNLELWMKLRKPLDYERVRWVLRRWRPYAGLIYFHLLLYRLAESGRLPVELNAAT